MLLHLKTALHSLRLTAGWQNDSRGQAALFEQPCDRDAGTGAAGGNCLGHCVFLETEGDEQMCYSAREITTFIVRQCK
jgi:hypothetical protein